MPARSCLLRSAARRFGGDDRAAISAMYAVAILPLVVMAGVAFDYGRMVGLDSELQNAADQAALAAATQLDGSSSAITNSQAAAANALGNQTRFANDGGGRAIPSSGLSFVYFEGYANDLPVNQTTDPVKARVVLVNVEDRAVRYALTPVMATFSGGVARGSAMATMESATCNVPPLMFCAPKTAGVVNASFPTSADIGRGLTLHLKNTNNSYPWAPGDFGFLDIDYGLTGSTKTRSVGLNSDFLGCAGSGVETDPGNKDPQADAMNSRMDFYSGSVSPADCDKAGNFCPSNNVRKSQYYTEVSVKSVKKGAAQPARPVCGSYDSRTGPTDSTAVKGFDKDTCFNTSSCGSDVIGDGKWDYQSYFNSHNQSNASYQVPTAMDFGKSDISKVTRWDVYNWENSQPSLRMKSEFLPSSPAPVSKTSGANTSWTFTNYCAYPTPVNAPPGIGASSSQKDRRLLTVAAVDCTGLNGKAPTKILRWVDLFLLKQVPNTGSDKTFFTEIVGPAKLAGGQSAFQNYSRKKAVLLR